MGRVSRYKKIKAFDPYSKQNGGRVNLDNVGVWGMGADGRKTKKKSKTVQKIKAQKHLLIRKEKQDPNSREYDAPPQDKDDFDLADLMGTLKKEKPVVLAEEPIPVRETIAVKSLPSKSLLHIDAHEEHAHKLLKLDAQVEPKKKVVEAEGRMEGESKKAYQRRVKTETRQIINRVKMDEQTPEKRKRKKDFLDNKKKKKKGKKSAAYVGREDDDSDDESVEGGDDKFVTGEQAIAARARATKVQFGEQALRPPTFRPTMVPRGAPKKAELKSQSPDKRMNEKEITAEAKSMDLMRRKVQAQYRLIKSQRKNAGVFHL
jgi:hypothetical protein